jgi:FAD synthetase
MKKGKTVLASGAFDLLHYGHIRFLEESKKAGGEGALLIVVVARDSTVKKMKGKHPVIPEDQRRALVEALKPVDKAILGSELFDVDEILDRVKPDVVAVGHDQINLEKAVRELIAKEGLKIEVVKIGRFGPKELASSSKIKLRIVEGSER